MVGRKEASVSVMPRLNLEPLESLALGSKCSGNRFSGNKISSQTEKACEKGKRERQKHMVKWSSLETEYIQYDLVMPLSLHSLV